MKHIWILSLLFAFAGCQPDVQESPEMHPAPVSESDIKAKKKPTTVTPELPKVPEKAEVPLKVKPEPAKVVTEKTVSKPETASAPVAEATADKVEQNKIEKPIEAEPVAATTTTHQVQLSEADAMALAKKKNCFACHALDKKVVGPAWRAVAQKYRGDAGAQAALESKVRKGGKGNWGSIAMPPQSALKEDELTGLVQFVLQLK